MAWLIVGQCAFFALYFCGWTWVRARRTTRTMAETAKMWLTGWMSAGFLSAGVLLATGMLIDGYPMSRPTLYLVSALAVGALVVAFAGGFIHAWAVRRIERLGPDVDYGDLDDVPPPAGMDRR